MRLETGQSVEFRSREAGSWGLLTARLELDDSVGGLDDVARLMYGAVLSRLASDRVAARFWNFIPDIHGPAHGGLDRYRAFNIGRHAALMSWSGSEAAFTRLLPTATGVGHDGRELVVHCLACDLAQAGIENPRQQPAYRYSRKYGPVSPSFARATLVRGDGGERELLIGGTSSVRGEESLHDGDVSGQLSETLANLRALIAHAGWTGDEPLACVEGVRVYYVRPADLGVLSERLGEVLGGAGEIEFVRADICRAELLVEIECVARLGGPADALE